MKKLTRMSMLALAFAMVGCSGENPLGTQINRPDGISELVAPPMMVPFTGVYVETFTLVEPFPPPILNLELHGEGFATHLGNSTFDGPLQGEAGVTTAQLTFTAANGDELEMSIRGVTIVDEVTITFFGDWMVTGGSGRFKNGTGSGTYNGGGPASGNVADIFFDGEISRPAAPRSAGSAPRSPEGRSS